MFSALAAVCTVYCSIEIVLITLHYILFLLYTTDLTRLIESHDLHPHGYADDYTDLRLLSRIRRPAAAGAHACLYRRCCTVYAV